MDLDAIRARRARANAIAAVLGRTPADDDADALLAEVDRLRSLAPWTGSNHVQHDIAVEEGRLIERARVLPVIEAARASLYIVGETTGDYRLQQALRAALAEYDR